MTKQAFSRIGSDSLTATTSNGRRLCFQRLGDGPAMVICHGSFSSASDWTNVAKRLAEKRSVYLYDRRGRGENPDSDAPHSLATEIDDLAAIMAIAGEGAALFGHSFGGGCSLMYAIRAQFRGRLLLYEPAHSITAQFSESKLPKFRALLDADTEAATAYCLEQLAGVESDQLLMLQASIIWPRLIELTPSFFREVEMMDSMHASREDLGLLPSLTSLFMGETSGEKSKRHTFEILQRLGAPALIPIREQGHSAHVTDPAQLSNLILRCLDEN